jgi:hypothetical protein
VSLLGRRGGLGNGAAYGTPQANHIGVTRWTSKPHVRESMASIPADGPTSLLHTSLSYVIPIWLVLLSRLLRSSLVAAMNGTSWSQTRVNVMEHQCTLARQTPPQGPWLKIADIRAPQLAHHPPLPSSLFRPWRPPARFELSFFWS